MSVQSYILHNEGFELKVKEMPNISSTTSTTSVGVKEERQNVYTQKKKIQLMPLAKWVGQVQFKNIGTDTKSINL